MGRLRAAFFVLEATVLLLAKEARRRAPTDTSIDININTKRNGQATGGMGTRDLSGDTGCCHHGADQFMVRGNRFLPLVGMTVREGKSPKRNTDKDQGRISSLRLLKIQHSPPPLTYTHIGIYIGPDGEGGDYFGCV